MKGSIVVTGGGTGGHLAIAKAIIEELYNHRGIHPIYIGSINGQDKAWFEDNHLVRKAYFLNSKGVVNQNFFGKFSSLFKITKEVNHCINLFDALDVEKVISVGGYSAAPASMAAVLTRTNLYIHEQNSKIGRLNKLIKPFSKKFFSSFDEKSPVKDYPIEDKYFDEARVRDKVQTIIFLGGSQGAKSINSYALKVASKLNQMGIKIIHQTGKIDLKEITESYKRLKIDADVFDFSKNLSQKMGKADFAVSRAGASTLWELCANALPTLFIPYPYAADDHQYHNANFLKEQNLCFLKREKDLTQKYLFECLEEDLHFISKQLVNSVMMEGTQLLVDAILEEI